MSGKITTDWGYVIEVGKTDELGVSILVVKPGGKLPAHYHKIMKEYEMILEGEAIVNGKRMVKDSLSIWNQGDIHEYINESEHDLKILCITIPPYIPDDEIRIG
jgi:mannose-6-phosphate isomerase-like protein (cupin superfamily)